MHVIKLFGGLEVKSDSLEMSEIHANLSYIITSGIDFFILVPYFYNFM